MLLLEGLTTIACLNGQLVAVELDGDILWRVLLHVECQLVLVALLHLEQDGSLRSLGSGGRDVVLGLLHLVVHLLGWGRGHGGRGDGVLWLVGNS